MLFGRQPRRRNFFRKAQVAPYQAHRFQNPFFRSKPKHSLWVLAITGFSLGLVLALASFFLTAPIFKITAVRVEGIETIGPKEIYTLVDDYLSSRAWLVFNHRNRFLFETKDLETILNKKYFFSSLQIIREGQTVAIIIKEKISSFLWQTNTDRAFLLDETGAVIRATTTEELTAILHPPVLQGPTLNGQLLPEPVQILVFNDLANKPVAVGQAVLSETEVKNLRDFFETLKNNQIYIENFELNRNVGSWFSAKTTSGYAILFDPSGDIFTQINHLLLVLKEQIKDVTKLEYIDVRFGDHVYYK